MQQLVKQLYLYIQHCPQYLVLQTRWHKPYRLLQLVYLPLVSYRTITFDFILELPMLNKGYNIILLLIDKYTKKIFLPPRKTIYLAAEQARALIDQLDLVDWGIPKAIILDCDPKFLSELQTAMHKVFAMKLLYFTAYHLQIDSASEQTNQTAEIALQFYLYTID